MKISENSELCDKVISSNFHVLGVYSCGYQVYQLKDFDTNPRLNYDLLKNLRLDEFLVVRHDKEIGSDISYNNLLDPLSRALSYLKLLSLSNEAFGTMVHQDSVLDFLMLLFNNKQLENFIDDSFLHELFPYIEIFFSGVVGWYNRRMGVGRYAMDLKDFIDYVNSRDINIRLYNF